MPRSPSRGGRGSAACSTATSTSPAPFRELLAEFREVEENSPALDRNALEQIAAWDGSKGELLDRLVGDRHAIAGSDQGHSFHDFLLSRSRQEELSELLALAGQVTTVGDLPPRGFGS